MSFASDTAERMMQGELLVFPRELPSGRFGHTSQYLRSKGYRLRTRKEADGLYVWAQWTGTVTDWSVLKKGSKRRGS